MIISHFLEHYEFKLENENVPQAFSWDFAVVPHPLAKLLVKDKVEGVNS